MHTNYVCLSLYIRQDHFNIFYHQNYVKKKKKKCVERTHKLALKKPIQAFVAIYINKQLLRTPVWGYWSGRRRPATQLCVPRHDTWGREDSRIFTLSFRSYFCRKVRFLGCIPLKNLNFYLCLSSGLDVNIFYWSFAEQKINGRLHQVIQRVITNIYIVGRGDVVFL